MRYTFTKMHGCGNDYLYINALETPVAEPEALSRFLSDRHKGVGSDGLVLICPSAVAHAKMRMFNADGSEGRMCGNAIRCVGKYLMDRGLAPVGEIRIETLAGIKTLWPLDVQDGKVLRLKADLDKPGLLPGDIPTTLPACFDQRVEIGGKSWQIDCVSMGSAHCVTYVEDAAAFPLEKYGPLFEHDPIFPERVNAEFVQVLGKNRLRMRVWEKGSGETWACGTGSCAAAVSAVLRGYADYDAPITVELRGGELEITVTHDTILMAGPATEVFTGEIEL